MPSNLVENLSKVQTSEGRITFERFCAGLKIAILRHEAAKNRINVGERRGPQPEKDNDDQEEEVRKMVRTKNISINPEWKNKIAPFSRKGRPVRKGRLKIVA